MVRNRFWKRAVNSLRSSKARPARKGRNMAAVMEPVEQRMMLTVLTFDPTEPGGARVDQNYGDRVTAVDQDGFSYGATGGFTPQVVVDYLPGMSHWPSDFGDLQNAIYQEDTTTLGVTLRADAGFQVSLASLDLGGFPNANYTVNSVVITDGAGNVLFSQTQQSVLGQTGTPRHTHL